jgi:nicotinate-nucleotide pyrophosphorylase (carboxylating)
VARFGARTTLEASGGIDLETVREIAEAGVDRISIGALTHSACWADVSLEVRQGSATPGRQPAQRREEPPAGGGVQA